MSFTWQTLWNSTLVLKPHAGSYDNSPKIVLKRIIPFIGTKSIVFQYECDPSDRTKRNPSKQFIPGVSFKGLHSQSIMFSGVTITEEEPPYDNFLIEYKGKKYYVQKPQANRHKIFVRCDCPDFYFTWSYYNWQKGALFGVKARPYIRKTTTRPERNPAHVAGACKHIWEITRLLKLGGYIL